IDTPMNLYDKPANLFVAGFIGSPAMNLVQGTLRFETHWTLATANGDIVLGQPPQSASWLPWRGRKVVLGIRPEDLQPAAVVDAAFSARIEVLEPVGNEIFLNLRHGAQVLVSRVPPRQLPEPGSMVPLALAGERLHLFDPASGARVRSLSRGCGLQC
ncbi:MAG: TOBE domain-containing protein, partial [Rhodanobacter sp.]